MDVGHRSTELVEPTPVERLVMSLYSGVGVVILALPVICGFRASLERVRTPKQAPRTHTVSSAVEPSSDQEQPGADERYAQEMLSRIGRFEAAWCGSRYESPSFRRLGLAKLVEIGIVPPEVLTRAHGYTFEVSSIHQPCDVVAIARSHSKRAASFWCDRTTVRECDGTYAELCLLPFDGRPLVDK